MGNWEAIENRKTLNIPGSCTEAQVSHVLSERFSRDPLGWSDKGLGKLTKLRVYVKNGGRIKAEDFREHERNTTYREYADRVIMRQWKGQLTGVYLIEDHLYLMEPVVHRYCCMK